MQREFHFIFCDLIFLLGFYILFCTFEMRTLLNNYLLCLSMICFKQKILEEHTGESPETYLRHVFNEVRSDSSSFFHLLLHFIMRTSNGLCQCNSCMAKQQLNALNFTPQFREEVKKLFSAIDIPTMTRSLQLVFDLALYHTDEVIDTPQKEALYQVNFLRKELEALGKS